MKQLTDPVCGMQIKEDSQFLTHLDNSKHYFCSQHYLDSFTKEHEKYLGNDKEHHEKHDHSHHQNSNKDDCCGSSIAAEVTKGNGVYYCPMHCEGEKTIFKARRLPCLRNGFT